MIDTETMRQRLELAESVTLTKETAIELLDELDRLRLAQGGEAEWYHGVDRHGVNHFYHKSEVRPSEFSTPLYTSQPLQADACKVPQGWQLVPVEPPPEMLTAAGMMANYDCHAPGASPDYDHVEWWRAMLSASPAAPIQVEPETFEQWNAKHHGDPEEIGFLQALRIAYCSGQDRVLRVVAAPTQENKS